ncbi:hypothetical protein OAD32_02925 [Porticoccaceae bacterium]|nr:hypothetical protein [Porticoccaceae bacterium]MDB9706313.1 hypothetical protein [Porticoccaceae bacterium]MDB9736995.1 hypothetical protein [Porticoccaceae bacterium]MDB9804750.1 hypothetical protein [Porticoccaceae bacterium]MDB9948860.1 hypothetical protein [Porticoccaceae bacterium]
MLSRLVVAAVAAYSLSLQKSLFNEVRMENSMVNRTDSEYLSTLERGLRVLRSFSAQRCGGACSSSPLSADISRR